MSMRRAQHPDRNPTMTTTIELIALLSSADKAALSKGHHCVVPVDENGEPIPHLVRVQDPEYVRRTFRPMRWMTPADVAGARREPDMEIGEKVTYAVDFHPRHGVKRRTIVRLA